jgi:hypothetical protein
MATPQSQSEPLKVHGPPRRLRVTDAALPRTGPCKVVLPPSHEGGQETVLPAQIVQRRGYDQPQLRVRFPRYTVPGEYAAKLEIDGESLDIMVTVEPHERLVVRPPESVFHGKPGDSSEVTLTIFNRGNVPFEIPSKFVVGVYDDDGVEEAFVTSYRMDTNDWQAIFGNWVLKLRDGYGGLVKCSVAGAGALAPDQQRTITITARLPSKLRHGHSYHGIHEFGALFYPFGINVHRRRSSSNSEPAISDEAP